MVVWSYINMIIMKTMLIFFNIELWKLNFNFIMFMLQIDV